MDKQLDWMRECTRRTMIGHHVPDYDQLSGYRELVDRGEMPGILEHIDPRALVRELRKAHIQGFWFYSKGHQGNAYYPSRIGHVHSALQGRDLFGEYTEACLSEGIVPLCVYEFSDHRMPKDHPDWCHQLPPAEGLDTTDADQGMRVGGACLNGPYGDFVLEQTREVLSTYPVKGYYVDFLGLFGLEDWRCPYCEPKYEQALGRPFRPVSEMTHDEYVAYVRWRYEQNDRYAKRMAKLIKDLRPDVAFTHNLHTVSDDVSMQRMGFAVENCDMLAKDIFHLRWGLLFISWGTRLLGRWSRYKPGDVLLDSTVCYADFTTTKALDSYRAEMWTGRCTNCASTSSIYLNIDGTIDPHLYALNKALYADQKEYEPWFADMDPVANVGLVRSQDTAELRPKLDYRATQAKTGHHVLGFEGWAQVLTAGHFLWDVVPDEFLQDEHLRRYKVLVLPNVACLREDRVAALRRFVEAGGRLVTTGETSLFDENGHAHSEFALADVLGVHYVEPRAFERAQLKVPQHLLDKGRPWQSDVLALRDGHWGVRAVPGAKVLGHVLARPLQQQLVNFFQPTDWPGLVEHALGKGRAFYFASTPGVHYRINGQYNIKAVMRNLLARALGRAAPVSLEGPETLELFAHTQAGREHLVVNLVNACSAVTRLAGKAGFRSAGGIAGPMRFDETESMPRVAEAALRLRPRGRRTVKRAYRAPDRKRLTLRAEGRDAVVTLRDLGVHTTVVVEYAPAKGR